MRTIKRLLTLSLVLLGSIFFTPANQLIAAGPPDVINLYQVTVDPQTDGTLVMKYDFDYTATTDFPSDSAYLEIGVPNKDFTIQDFGPKPFVTRALPKTSGTSQVRLEFNRLPKKGDNFKLTFTIKQSSMAYALGDNATFRFTPGWFDFAEIKLLRIIWKLPTDSTLVGKLNPPPIKQGESQAVWETTNLAPNAKFTVEIYVSKKAFSNLKAIEAPLPSASSPTTSTADEGGGDWLFWLIVVIILVIVVLFIFALLIGALEGGGGYGGGIGGYSGGGGISGGGGGGSIFGGGGGGFSGGGGGSSGCACACACAGGGRAGCSKRLGFDVSLFLKTRLRKPAKKE